MTSGENDTNGRAAISAASFGAMVRERRRAFGLTQDELALATGVGRRFVIDLEAGKATGHLGRSLLVAQALGLALRDVAGPPSADAGHLGLPDDEEADVGPAHIL